MKSKKENRNESSWNASTHLETLLP